MSFWKSEVGDITGKPEEAFTKVIGIIPDNTRALAQIKKFEYVNRDEFQFHQITWDIIAGEFKGGQVRQKIKTFDLDSNKRHTALNMMRLIYTLFNIAPSGEEIPNAELTAFNGKVAGIVIKEWSFNGKEGNWVSEVHPAVDFECKSGVKKEAKPPAKAPFVDISDLNDDLPF